MPDTIMGGSNYCRLCGSRHTNAECHMKDEISQLLSQQLKAESLKSFSDTVLLTKTQRTELEQMINGLRAEMRIPKKQIFISKDPRLSVVAQLLDRKRLSQAVKEHEDNLKNEAMSTETSYEIAKYIISFLNEIPMTAKMQYDMTEHIEWLSSV